MGLFCVNFHFRTADDKALSEALKRRGATRHRIVPAKSGWTSLYEEQASEQDDRRIRDLAAGLSKDLLVAAIAFLVHDSDIACYWLYENGELLDEYNSAPGYFDESDGPPTPSGGRTDVLVRYCKPGVSQDDLAQVLSENTVRATTFADDLIRRLAKALGIDSRLAIADYRDQGDIGDPGDLDDDDEGPGDSPVGPGLVERLAKKFGLDMGGAQADPQATALVRAAGAGNTDEIDRLLAAGVSIDAEAPAPLSADQSMAGLAQLFPGGMPKIMMTPLLAAIVNNQLPAAERLLQAGANPNHVHPRHGTAVHAAVAAGNADLLHLLINHGADLNVRNAQGQMPVQTLAACRAAADRLNQMQAQLKSMGVTHPGIAGHLAKVKLPVEGWEACERLLREHGAL
jgi:hypothetical protein